jgi:hypothetical protein
LPYPALGPGPLAEHGFLKVYFCPLIPREFVRISFTFVKTPALAPGASVSVNSRMSFDFEKALLAETVGIAGALEKV